MINAAAFNMACKYSEDRGTIWIRDPLVAAAAQSRSAKIAEEHQKPKQDVRDIVPEEFHDYLDVFEKKAADKLPPRRPYDVTIDLLPGQSPPFKHIYGLSPTELDTLKVYLEENLDSHIHHSKSPAGAPVLFVKKKDGSLRLCVDYRGLNAMTVKNRYPLPLPNEILDRLQGAKHFTKIDLRAGYSHIRIAEGDKWKTAFRTRYGHFEYCIMPFGLTNAPAAFQHMMNDVFRDLLDICVIIYLDDILIFSKDAKEHKKIVREVLRRMREHGLYAKPEKCDFLKNEIEYLGFVINENGVRMDSAKIDGISDWPTPKSVKDIQVFLGFANFYRRFIKNYSKIARPMMDLLCKDVPFLWTPSCQSSFDDLKKSFVTAPVLIHANPSMPYFIETDSSDYARGAVISQNGEDGKLHPIAFQSKSLTPAERNYDIYDKELLAIISAFKDWRQYLEGASHLITVFTDHRNLETLMDTKILTCRQARWAEFIAHYDFQIIYKEGKSNGKADALSRRADHLPKRGVEAPKSLLKPSNFGLSISILEVLADVELAEHIKQ